MKKIRWKLVALGVVLVALGIYYVLFNISCCKERIVSKKELLISFMPYLSRCMEADSPISVPKEGGDICGEVKNIRWSKELSDCEVDNSDNHTIYFNCGDDSYKCDKSSLICTENKDAGLNINQ